MNIFVILLAVLSIWDYPARQPKHDQLRLEFVSALRRGDTTIMEATCREGVKLLPDDPTWHYNLACSLAYFPKRSDEAFDELEKAIDLGFRDVDAIVKDTDLKRLSKLRRYDELIEYAKLMKLRPLMFGPMAVVNATGIFGETISLGEQNFSWDFDVGAFVTHLKMAPGVVQGNTGDLYMNRDGGHSPNGPQALQAFLKRNPGLTEVRLDEDARKLPPNKRPDLTFPNMLFPYPVFGNSSMSFVNTAIWRSIPRALTTHESRRLKAMQKMYLSNQIWVFPSNADTAPVGTNGDVFASITPYYLTSAGRSWSDIPLLEAALLASRSFKAPVKKELIKRGMLSPTIMTLMRKSFGIVNSEDEYTSSRAHPTAIPPNIVNTNRLMKAASQLEIKEIPPMVAVRVTTPKLSTPPLHPELIYATPFAWSYVIRAEEPVRKFELKAMGAKEYRFVQTHGKNVKVKITELTPDSAEVELEIAGLNPTNRVDVAVFGRNPGTGWGAPSYISFARMDPDAPYSDPVLTFLKEPSAK